MNSPPSRVLRIGDVRTDPAIDEICKDGKTVKLEPRTMRLLICLAEHAGEVVSVDQLLDQVWKDVVVSPDSVYQAIAALWRILGDDPKKPTIIVNVMRRGYRLIAPVVPWVDTQTAADDSSAGTVAADTRLLPDRDATTGGSPTWYQRRGTVILAFGALLLMCVLGQRYWVSTHSHSSKGQDVPATHAESDKSVAVLPFINISDDKDSEYFSDGLSEELINLLTQIPDLRVPARTSSFYFKGKQATIANIANALGVAYLLEGSVRKSGKTIRITAQLVRADTGYQVWSKTFDRQLDDIFKVQDEIASSVIKTLKVSLLDSAPPRTAISANSEAYTLYLRGQALGFSAESPAESRSAADYLRKSLNIDPEFAPA